MTSDGISLASLAATPADRALEMLNASAEAGLSTTEAQARLERYGPNAVTTHGARFLSVLWHQVRSPLLALLLAAATASYAVGERNDAIIIWVIVAMSVGLGFVNEYRAEKAAQALHEQISHQAYVTRDGTRRTVGVAELVPGDIVHLELGEVVPADIRLLEVNGLECDESMMTGESQAVEKSTEPVPAGTALADLDCCALMGTVVHAGGGSGVVVATGARAEFGSLAAGLSTHQLDTTFQTGLRHFSMMLVYVAGALTSGIFVANLVLHRPVLDSLLFSLAIAVGITPQLLPAVVSTSLAAGSRRMRKRRVLVKRLVCIEDLGDVETLFTDKTGTLTLGSVRFARALGSGSARAADVLRWGLLTAETPPPPTQAEAQQAGGNQLDSSLAQSPAAGAVWESLGSFERIALLPFDHDRRMVSVVVRDASGVSTLVAKGAPETVLERCTDVLPEARTALDAEFAAGNRVVAVATCPAPAGPLLPAHETGMELVGFLVFLDPPKADAAQALERLTRLGITVKVVTGDNPAVAVKVCGDLGLGDPGVLTGAGIDALTDEELTEAVATTTVFARVSPTHKARIVKAGRARGGGVAFLGDGVNDALALHAADVGISVDSGTDVAKDAADVILLDKDLDVLADGVAEGRRIFANTIKYVLMGTSSNFGNMFSAASASLFLSFLPMLPSQVLLNNLLYDTSQLAIPTDHVDEEQLRRPSHWDLGFIRRFMFVFGPLSSIFDFTTFAVMLGLLHAGHAEFRSGWFVESLATQTLVIFAIRTHKVPFFRSRPSLEVTLAALGVVAIGAILPATPLAGPLGFARLPGEFFAVLAAMVCLYLVLIEIGKRWFYRLASQQQPPTAHDRPHHEIKRRARRFGTAAVPVSRAIQEPPLSS